MKKAIVTGASGFVGSALVKLLSAKGIETIAVVRSEASVLEHIRNLPNVSIYFCDMEHITDLMRQILDRDFDVFFHFAWEGTAGPERANIKLQLDNIKRTCDAVTVAKGLGCSKFVNACSIMQYEAAKYVPQDNSSPGMGAIYSEAKQAADLMAKTLSVKLGLNYNGVIISNIYGPYEKSERFLNTVLMKMLRGEDVNLTECTQLYDFIFVDDAVEAIYRIAKSKNILNESVYIGNEKQEPLKEFVLKMHEIAESKSKLNFGTVPYRGVSLSYDEFDTSKLKTKLGFIPEVSFAEGVKITADWLLESVWGRDKKQDFSFIKTPLDGVKLITPFFREDKRGTFLKSIEKDIYCQLGGVTPNIQEDFESFSGKNVVRGLHFQTRNPQTKIVRVIFGKVLDVIVDLRRNSPTLGQHFSMVLSSENHYSLWIPAGFAHGFSVLSDDGALMSYKCIGKYEPSFDTGILWNDSVLNIQWGIEHPIFI